MSKHSGREGTVKIGANSVGELRNWEYTVETDVQVAASVTDTYEQATSTISRISGSITVWWDDEDTVQASLMAEGAAVTLLLYPEGSTTGDAVDTIPAIITSQQYTNGGNDGYMEAVYSFRNSTDATLNGTA